IALATRTGGTLDGTVTVAPGSVVSTAGRWINDAIPGAVAEPAQLNGGSIALTGTSVVLGEGSALDVSAGARLAQNGRLSAGDAGSITLSATTASPANVLADFGPMQLGGELRGYGTGGKGGALSLTAAMAQIGPGAQRDPRELVIDPAFFQRGGF